MSDPEESLTSAPEGSSSLPPSHRLDSIPEGDNNVNNNNGTASGWPCCNRRALTQYNPQYNVPTIQWVSDKQAFVAELFLKSNLGGTFIIDSWGKIKGTLSYQVVDHGTLTPVGSRIYKAKKFADPYDYGLVEALNIHQSEQWTKSMTE